MKLQVVEEERRYRAPALEKGLDIIEMMASRMEATTLSQMSSMLGRSTNQLFRMVQVLEYRGYLESTSDGYVLTDRFLTLSMRHMPVKSVSEVALAPMHLLALETNHSCHLTIRSGDQIIVVMRAESPAPLDYMVKVGHRAPLVLASSGLLLYGLLPLPMREILQRQLRQTVKSADLKKFIRTAEDAAANGFIERPSRLAPSVIDLCAPLQSANGIAATLSIPYVDTLGLSMGQDAARDALLAAANRISQALGHVPLTGA